MSEDSYFYELLGNDSSYPGFAYEGGAAVSSLRERLDHYFVQECHQLGRFYCHFFYSAFALDTLLFLLVLFLNTLTLIAVWYYKVTQSFSNRPATLLTVR